MGVVPDSSLQARPELEAQLEVATYATEPAKKADAGSAEKAN